MILVTIFIDFKEKLIISTIVAISICTISGVYQILSVRFEFISSIELNL